MGRIGKPIKLLQNHRIMKALNTEEKELWGVVQSEHFNLLIIFDALLH